MEHFDHRLYSGILRLTGGNQKPWGKPTKYVPKYREENTFKNSRDAPGN